MLSAAADFRRLATRNHWAAKITQEGYTFRLGNRGTF